MVPNCSCEVAGCNLTFKQFEVVTRSVGRICCKGFTKILGDGSERITNLHDVVERKFSKMSTRLDASLANRGKKAVAQFEACLADQVKDEVRKEFYSFLWS